MCDQAAAFYYHGLILDKGSEPNSHVSAASCIFVAEELLIDSKRASLSFCLAVPVNRCFLFILNHLYVFYVILNILSSKVYLCRIPPAWGVMKHLHKKIPEVASKKLQMYGYLFEQDKNG